MELEITWILPVGSEEIEKTVLCVYEPEVQPVIDHPAQGEGG